MKTMIGASVNLIFKQIYLVKNGIDVSKKWCHRSYVVQRKSQNVSNVTVLQAQMLQSLSSGLEGGYPI